MARAGFEKLADLYRRIGELEAKARSLWGSRPGTLESDLLQQTVKRVEELKREQSDLRGLLTQRGEPDHDPVAAVRCLPRATAKAFRAYFFEGRSMRDAAAKTGMATSTLARRIDHALDVLTTFLNTTA